MPITSAGTAVASEEDSAYDLEEDEVTTTDCWSGSRAGCSGGGGGGGGVSLRQGIG